MKKTVLEINGLLHDIQDEQAQCIDRLIGSLEKREGIKEIQLEKNNNLTLQLSIKFDEVNTSEEEIIYNARKIGKKLDETFGHIRIKMRKIDDAKHVDATTAVLKNMKGVMSVLAAPTGWIFLEFNKYITQESILKELIEKLDLFM